jgi:hypothetical protein
MGPEWIPKLCSLKAVQAALLSHPASIGLLVAFVVRDVRGWFAKYRFETLVCLWGLELSLGTFRLFRSLDQHYVNLALWPHRLWSLLVGSLLVLGILGVASLRSRTQSFVVAVVIAAVILDWALVAAVVLSPP